MKYFAYDETNYDFKFFETEEEAKKAAENYLEYYAEDASSEGWPEDINICYGKIMAQTIKKIIEEKKDYTDEEWGDMGYSEEYDEIIDYNIEKINNGGLESDGKNIE